MISSFANQVRINHDWFDLYFIVSQLDLSIYFVLCIKSVVFLPRVWLGLIRNIFEQIWYSQHNIRFCLWYENSEMIWKYHEMIWKYHEMIDHFMINLWIFYFPFAKVWKRKGGPNGDPLSMKIIDREKRMNYELSRNQLSNQIEISPNRREIIDLFQSYSHFFKSLSAD